MRRRRGSSCCQHSPGAGRLCSPAGLCFPVQVFGAGRIVWIRAADLLSDLVHWWMLPWMWCITTKKGWETWRLPLLCKAAQSCCSAHWWLRAPGIGLLAAPQLFLKASSLCHLAGGAGQSGTSHWGAWVLHGLNEELLAAVGRAKVAVGKRSSPAVLRTNRRMGLGRALAVAQALV